MYMNLTMAVSSFLPQISQDFSCDPTLIRTIEEKEFGEV